MFRFSHYLSCAAAVASSTPIFDTHCHIGMMRRPNAVEDYRRAVAASVTRMTIVGVDLATTLIAKKLSQGTRLGPGVYWTSGLHPCRATDFDRDYAEIERLARDPTCVAVGETGLDKYRDSCALDIQMVSFRRHLELSRELRKPVIIHCRNAFEEMLPILREFAPVHGVMHCFNGDAKEAVQSTELGLYISYSGVITYPKSRALRDSVGAVPDDKVLVETDSPFLPPQSRRGQRNEPSYITETVKQIAQLKHWSEGKARQTTWNNANALFGV